MIESCQSTVNQPSVKCECLIKKKPNKEEHVGRLMGDEANKGPGVSPPQSDGIPVFSPV